MDGTAQQCRVRASRFRAEVIDDPPTSEKTADRAGWRSEKRPGDVRECQQPCLVCQADPGFEIRLESSLKIIAKNPNFFRAFRGLI